MEKPIVMIGLMGVGKSDIGRRLAHKLNVDFTDSDDVIRLRADGLSPRKIFEKHGEAYFRDLEHKVIKELLAKGKGVISTGGGAVMTPETARIIWANAHSIWLKADLETYLARIGNPKSRPMLNGGDPHDIISALIKERYPVYEKADTIIDAKQSKSKVVQNCLDALKGRYERKR